MAGVALGDILCVAGVALGDIFVSSGKRGTWRHSLSFHIDPRFAWQAWRLLTSTFVLRHRRGTWRHPPSFCVAGVALVALGWVWWRTWSPLVARDAAELCVAGVALGEIHLRIFVSRGKRGTWGHSPSFCVAGVALLVARLVAVSHP